MSQFYLHIRYEDEWIEDPEGSDLPNLEAARVEALAAARDFLAVRIRAGQVIQDQYFDIADEDGTVLTTVSFLNSVMLTSSAYKRLESSITKHH